MGVLRLVNGIPRTVTTLSYYDAETTIGVGGLTTGASLTLPSSGTYQSQTDLEVYINDIPQEPITDWLTVGSAPRTQVQFTFDLVQNDRVRFRLVS